VTGDSGEAASARPRRVVVKYDGAAPTDAGAGESERAGPRKIELAKAAYVEVLDATKHQDDKVGRFLTAIAFLTTGAIALVARDNGLRRSFSFDNGNVQYPLLAWAVGAFFVLTLASVTLLLLCLSVPVRLPQAPRDPMKGSHLFYSYIAAKPIRAWTREWNKCASCLEKEIAHDYVREAHNLAERVAAKYRHSYEASWLFVSALLFLGVAVYLKIEVSLVEKDRAVSIGTGELAILGVIACTHASLQVYTRAVHDTRSIQKLRDHHSWVTSHPLGAHESVASNADSYNERRWTGLVIVPVLVYTFALLFPWPNADAASLLVALVVAIPLFWVLWLTGDFRSALPEGPKSGPVLAAMVTVGGAVAAVVAVEVDGLVRAIALLLPAVVLSAINAARPAVTYWRNRGWARTDDVDDQPDDFPAPQLVCMHSG
jgi:hypothetical protein